MTSAGEIYYQARFFDKSVGKTKAFSLPHNIKSHSGAYLYAREKAEEVLFPAMTKEEINKYGLLTVDEVKAIMALPDDKPEEARNTLITLLGITCGLGVSEIQCLERKHIMQNDTLVIEADYKRRIIPFIGNIKNRLKKMKTHFPDSQYIIPNLRDINKPCNPISITRGVNFVLNTIGVSRERNIIPSVLWETFISLLISCKKSIDIKIIDYLCGFNKAEDELSDIDKVNVIGAINSLMIKLEDMYYSALSLMEWGCPIS
jgi:integrase